MKKEKKTTLRDFYQSSFGNITETGHYSGISKEIWVSPPQFSYQKTNFYQMHQVYYFR